MKLFSILQKLVDKLKITKRKKTNKQTNIIPAYLGIGIPDGVVRVDHDKKRNRKSLSVYEIILHDSTE